MRTTSTKQSEQIHKNLTRGLDSFFVQLLNESDDGRGHFLRFLQDRGKRTAKIKSA
jgi:hypothetical protein